MEAKELRLENYIELPNGEITMEQAFEILDTIEEQSKPTP